MLGYIARRLLLIIPTLFGIMLINFVIVQAAPGGPVERMIAHIKHADTGGATERISSMGGETSGLRASSALQATPNSQYLGAQGVDPELIKRIEKMYGFDKSPVERFGLMIKSYLHFDFGKSYYRDVPVTQLIVEKMPVSISLGVWTMLLGYLVSIPLGIWKAVRDGGRFDVWSSTVIIIGYAVPSFLFAIFLIILFSGGSYWNIFPMHGLVSENWQSLSVWGKVSDYLWHMVLPIASMVVGGFASLTMLTKNSFLDEISKQYVVTARAKGLGERQVLLGHVFRNAMLIVIAGFPSAFIGVLFRSALLIEIIFSLDGMGLLGFEAIVNRDYPVVFGTLYIFTLIGLLLNLVGDLTYVLVDPRIDFERRADA